MILQKLPTYLEENNCKLLIKYDGERDINKYTIRLLYNDIKYGSLGKDTDSPCSLLNYIFKDNDFFMIKEMEDFFSHTINILIENLKIKFGNSCIISLVLEEKGEEINYLLHLQIEKSTKHISSTNFKELFELADSKNCIN